MVAGRLRESREDDLGVRGSQHLLSGPQHEAGEREHRERQGALEDELRRADQGTSEIRHEVLDLIPVDSHLRSPKKKELIQSI